MGSAAHQRGDGLEAITVGGKGGKNVLKGTQRLGARRIVQADDRSRPDLTENRLGHDGGGALFPLLGIHITQNTELLHLYEDVRQDDELRSMRRTEVNLARHADVTKQLVGALDFIRTRRGDIRMSFECE